MRNTFYHTCIIFFLLLLYSCSSKTPVPSLPAAPKPVTVKNTLLNGSAFDYTIYGTTLQPVIKVEFTEPVKPSSVTGSVKITNMGGGDVAITTTLQNHDSVLIVQPAVALSYLSKYDFIISSSLRSSTDGSFSPEVNKNFITRIDSSRKFPVISDNALLDLVQQQTFKYFWDYGHPVSGLARERSNATPETVTSGGSGFGVMAMVAAVSRGFITRAQGVQRIQTIVSFLKNMAPKFHGAFSHWMNGTTGVVVPFGTNDDGADLVETSYMMMGLLTARQFFNGADPAETTLRSDINTLWNEVDWNWFRQNGKKVLYWNWSPNSGFAVNVPVQGWNETLITYVLAASSPTHSIPKAVYDSGFARNGAMINNATYYGYQLPLGPSGGGPLFFEHYSFLGINPNGLTDAYANYTTQTKNHTLINYSYCASDPKGWFGYSDSCWGLTASDIQNGYTASSPTNDLSYIAPTGAVSSLPYTPTESMKALKFFYYVLGDKVWGQYGFKDSFSLQNLWFADSYLAIDQGPMIVMIENYRSGLLWNLFSSCPEIKTGMLSLGFSAPYL
ncbi:MAG TPA: glucoamylase family protein [Chitinophagaceae bacterium]|nr:glucoamylase family protein [Chitinophagaceae bacterium]